LTSSLFDIQFCINIGPWEQESLIPCLTELTRQGFNGIEVTSDTYHNFSDRIGILKEIVHNVGIEIVSYVLKMDFSQLSTDSSLLDQFQRVANFIRSMGGQYIIIEQGMKAEWDPIVEDQLADFERMITDFAGICRESGVELVFHPTADSFIRSSEVMDRMVELTYPLGTRICMDVCEFMTMGIHPIQFMKKYFDAIRIVHFNDMKINKGKNSSVLFPPEKTVLGAGKVDLKSIWTYLQAMEYKGWIVIDCPHDTSMDKDIARVTRYLSKDLEVFLTNLL